MLPAIKLIGFGMRQAIGMLPEVQTKEALGRASGSVVHLVVKHFTDHSKTLPQALARANDRAWQAVGIALAGDGFLDQIKLFFASGDDKGIRQQVRLFLQDKNIGFEGAPADFRKKCLTELNQAKKAGLFSAQSVSPNEVAQQAASFERYADPRELIDGAEQLIAQIADELASLYPNLAKLLRQRPSAGPPLLVAAFSFFFRRAVETNGELAHGLFFDGLRQLSAAQDNAFDEVGQALSSLGDQFEQVFEQLDRIETVLIETHVVAVETQETVLDMQAELQRLGSLHLDNADEIRRLIQEVLTRVSQAGMHKGEVKPQHSFSIRSEDERIAVKQLLARFRQLPTQQQEQVPALLNGLGKLQFGSGDFDGAKQTFMAVAEEVHDASAQAEAQFNAYRAALEEKKWTDALAAIQKASTLDWQRFAPFPMQRYQPKQLLGAGGFGAAFLCHDRNFDEEVVVKTLHDGALERTTGDVFREARLLRKLNHPAIIGVRECEFANALKQVRPYIVMDYFPGGSLESFIQKNGSLSVEDLLSVARQIAQGMQAAHQQNILHRDLKPDNVLVRKEDSTWKVKIIDFGLALRKQTIEASMAARSAGNTTLGDRVAGTVKYAPPEQMGEMKGVKPGPYSDVYAFGKMCCYAMFMTTEPKRRQWSEIAEELADMLEKCIEQDLAHRLPSFEPVLKVLEATLPCQKAEEPRQRENLQGQAIPKKGEPPLEQSQLKKSHPETWQRMDNWLQRQKEEEERQRREQEEAEEARQRAELERIRREEEEAERQRKQQEEARERAELEGKRLEQEEADRQRQALEQQELLLRQQEEEARRKKRLAEKEERRSWNLAQDEPTPGACEKYLERWPDGNHVDEARILLSSRLRRLLLEDLKNIDTRKRYLAVRSEDDKKMDKGSVPLKWHLAYMLYGVIVGGIAGYASGSAGNWVADSLGWWWIFRMPVQAVAGAFAGLIAGLLAGLLFYGVVLGDEMYAFALRLGENRSGRIAGLVGGIGFFCGVVVGAIGSPIAGAIIVAAILGLGFLAEKRSDKFGPLPFGSHILPDDAVRQIYLGEEMERRGQEMERRGQDNGWSLENSGHPYASSGEKVAWDLLWKRSNEVVVPETSLSGEKEKRDSTYSQTSLTAAS